MLSILFHLSLALGVLWYQRRIAYSQKPWFLALVWYGMSAVLVFIEAYVATLRPVSGLFIQGLVVAVFYVPAMFFALHWASRRRRSLAGPMAAFIVAALLSTLAAALFLARAEDVRGLPGGLTSELG